jgi:hypothetical protein
VAESLAVRTLVADPLDGHDLGTDPRDLVTAVLVRAVTEDARVLGPTEHVGSAVDTDAGDDVARPRVIGQKILAARNRGPLQALWGAAVAVGLSDWARAERERQYGGDPYKKRY